MRLAFIGGHGHHYLRSTLTDPNLTVERPVAIAGDGVDEAKARAFGASLGDVRWFADARDMLDTAQPDVVSVGAVYARNSEWTAAALERDIAVVSDKPIATSWEALARLRALTEGTPRLLLTEFPFRARPEFRAARTAVADGLIGEVVLATAQKSYKFGTRPPWYDDRALYGGTLLWIASHGIDVLRFTTGQAMQCLFGRQGNISQPGYPTMEDHVLCGFGLEGGGSGLVHADFLRPASAQTHGDDRLRLAGSRGLVEVRAGRCRLTTHGQPETDITDTAPSVPVYQALLAALAGGGDEYYSTAASLEMAELLLQARDVTDGV